MCKYWKKRFNNYTFLSDIENKYPLNDVNKIVSLVKERLVKFSDFNNLVDYYLNKPNYDLNMMKSILEPVPGKFQAFL